MAAVGGASSTSHDPPPPGRGVQLQAAARRPLPPFRRSPAGKLHCGALQGAHIEHVKDVDLRGSFKKAWAGQDNTSTQAGGCCPGQPAGPPNRRRCDTAPQAQQCLQRGGPGRPSGQQRSSPLAPPLRSASHKGAGRRHSQRARPAGLPWELPRQQPTTTAAGHKQRRPWRPLTGNAIGLCDQAVIILHVGVAGLLGVACSQKNHAQIRHQQLPGRRQRRRRRGLPPAA